MKQLSLFVPSLRFLTLNCEILTILSCHWENGQFRLDCESLIKMSAPQRAAWIGALVLCFWFSFQSRDLKTGQFDALYTSSRRHFKPCWKVALWAMEKNVKQLLEWGKLWWYLWLCEPFASKAGLMKTDIANCIEILEKCSTEDYVSSLTPTGTHLDKEAHSPPWPMHEARGWATVESFKWIC